MTRVTPILGSIVVLFIAPGTIAVLVPRWISGWQLEAAHGSVAFSVGSLLVAVGAIVLVECFGRFALIGHGTPAPMMPTRRLIVSGCYRHVRNPMYLGVLGIIVGQALIFLSPLLFVYAALVWLAYHMFVVCYEERVLQRTYGIDYEVFRANVPRWLPRLYPYKPHFAS